MWTASRTNLCDTWKRERGWLGVDLKSQLYLWSSWLEALLWVSARVSSSAKKWSSPISCWGYNYGDQILQVEMYPALLSCLFPFKVALVSWMCVSRSLVKYIGSARLSGSGRSQPERSISQFQPMIVGLGGELKSLINVCRHPQCVWGVQVQ